MLARVTYTRRADMAWHLDCQKLTCPCCAHVVLHFVILAIKLPVPGATAKDGRPSGYTKHTNHSYIYTSPTHPLASFQNSLGCALL